MEGTTKQYRIRVSKTELIGFGVAGERGISVRFNIEPTDGGPTIVYEGSAGGSEFISRCEQLKRKPIVIEATEPTSTTIETWKEKIVQRALDEVMR